MGTRVRQLHAEGDSEALVELIDREILDVWYGIPPDELRRILVSIPPTMLARHPQVFLLGSVFMTPGDRSAFAGAGSSFEGHPRMQRWMLLAEALRARLDGDAVAAYIVLRGAPEVVGSITQLIDPTGGFQSFFLAQAAATAALAGEFADALALNERLLLIAPRPGHEFLTRRAHVRSALLHGLFGDRAAARIHRRRATETPRTCSWIEPQIDLEVRLVDALLRIDDDADAAAEQALQLTYEPMGEFWPFFVMVAERAAITAGRLEDGRARLGALRATGLASAGVSGVAASVFGQELGLDAVLRGNVVQAREELAAADPDHWRTHFVEALVALLASNPRRAMREVAAAEPQTRGLRQAEYRRLAVLALAHFAEGEEAGSTAVITRIAQQLGPFDHAFLTMLSPGLMSQVEATAPGVRRDPRWVHDALGVLGRPRLSASELKVLAGLGRGLSREEIADSLFISANTVKSQLASLYRKLGVSSAGAAVREATHLDLL
ncbi:hypothetical protein LK09_03145 [Microbacterium mangrovi]|uniref:HTH luxR-type domain-containing protein n=1 Tax=Microbacterium mangrovi TaxID=1348253 RepID=A0A0B2A734_9MICO|nr:LuxR family transcriptional regulator [Microbacterium mangrovi]KHK99299.1 hypothetical protein LK09_03145 [Microbacterium mangrovi]